MKVPVDILIKTLTQHKSLGSTLPLNTQDLTISHSQQSIAIHTLFPLDIRPPNMDSNNLLLYLGIQFKEPKWTLHHTAILPTFLRRLVRPPTNRTPLICRARPRTTSLVSHLDNTTILNGMLQINCH